MHKINQILKQNQIDWIVQTVCVFDCHAEIFLFGLGVKYLGLSVDLYIKSEEIDIQTRELIKLQLSKYLRLNIDMVCELKDDTTLMNMRKIGMCIYNGEVHKQIERVHYKCSYVS